MVEVAFHFGESRLMVRPASVLPISDGFNRFNLEEVLVRRTHNSCRIVDLSIYLENDVLSDPPSLAPRITYQKHAETLPEFQALLPGTKAAASPSG